MALSVDEFRKLLLRVSNVKSIEEAERDILPASKMLKSLYVKDLYGLKNRLISQDADKNKDISQDTDKSKVIERYLATSDSLPYPTIKEIVMASLVPHVLSALIDHSAGEGGIL